MPNERPFDHIGNFNFKVEINGVTRGSVLALKMDTVTGTSGRQLPRIPGSLKWESITLKRGLFAQSSLGEWNSFLGTGAGNGRHGVIVQYDRSGRIAGRWELLSAWPRTWKLAGAASSSGEVHVEELTIAHESITFNSR